VRASTFGLVPLESKPPRALLRLMDPDLLRVSRSFRRSHRTRFDIARAVRKYGPGTIAQIADWTGLEPRRVRAAVLGEAVPDEFRPSASLTSVGVLAPVVARGGVLHALTPLGERAMREAERDPSFARARARPRRRGAPPQVSDTCRAPA